MEALGGAAAKADVDHDFVAAQEGDVFQEEPEHALALPHGDVRITPEAGKVGGQREDLLPLLLAEQTPPPARSRS